MTYLSGVVERRWIVRMQAVKGLSMEKWLCWGSLGVAGLMLLLFILDIALGTSGPFGGLSKTVDIIGIIASVVLGYLAWDAWQDLR
jgi:hypothetical protein